MKSILIRGGTIWDGTRFREGDVAVKDGAIAGIGDCGGFAADYELDASGAVVCPGLVDIHTHLRGLSPDVYGVLPEVCNYPFGVTAAADAGCEKTARVEDTFHLKTVIFVTVPIRDGKPDFAAAERVADAHEGHVAGYKVYYDKGMVPTDSAAPFREVCEYARRKGRRVMVHCTNCPVPMAELFACMGNGDICTHVFHGIGHTAAEDGFASLRYARQKGIILDVGLAGGVHGSYRIIRQALAEGLYPDTISTDIVVGSVFLRGGNFGMTMTMSILRDLGMDEEAVLRAVTSGAARAVGKEEEWGRLSAGGSADVAVLRYGPVKIDSTDRNGDRLIVENGYRCLYTIADGMLVHRADV